MPFMALRSKVMMLKHWMWVGLIMVWMILTGCTTNTDTPVATPLGGGMMTATPVTVATSSPETPSAVVPTSEPIATETPLPTAESTQAIEPTIITTPTEVSELLGVLVNELPSPDGAWVSTVIYDVEPFPNEIVFALTNTSTNEQLIVERLTGGTEAPLPYSPRPMAWDAASGTIYYLHYPVYMDGCAIYDGSALYGYNVATRTGSVLNEREGFYVKFSPDATHLAYLPSNSATEPSTIAVYDIVADTLQEVPFDATVVANPADEVMSEIVWHPIRPLVAMGVMVNVCLGVGSYSLVLLDTETMTQTKVEVETPFGFTIEGWEGENLLLVRTSENQLRKYDIDAGVWAEE
jgi:hypothetical protein